MASEYDHYRAESEIEPWTLRCLAGAGLVRRWRSSTSASRQPRRRRMRSAVVRPRSHSTVTDAKVV